MNSYRKSSVLRLRRFFNELLLDQIPNLSDLRHAVEQLSISDDASKASTSASLLIEPVSETYEELSQQTDWKQLVETQLKSTFANDEEARRKEIQRLAETYCLDQYDEVNTKPKCEVCANEAPTRCSRCRVAWYCSRQCQEQDWKRHKPACSQAHEKRVSATSPAKVKTVD